MCRAEPGHQTALGILAMLEQARADAPEKFADAESMPVSVAGSLRDAYMATCREGLPLVSTDQCSLGCGWYSHTGPYYSLPLSTTSLSATTLITSATRDW